MIVDFIIDRCFVGTMKVIKFWFIHLKDRGYYPIFAYTVVNTVLRNNYLKDRAVTLSFFLFEAFQRIIFIEDLIMMYQLPFNPELLGINKTIFDIIING